MDKINTINKTKKKKIISHFIFALLCLLWLISFIKVPVVGKIIDAIFFEFLFGYAKLIIYLLTLMMLICWYYKNLFYTLFSKRKDLSYLLIIIFVCLVLGIVSYFNNNQNNESNTFKEFFVGSKNSFFDKWVALNINNLLNIKDSFLATNTYAFGGLIGVLYVAITHQATQIVMFLGLSIIFIVFLFISILCWWDKALFFVNSKIFKKSKVNNKEQITITEKLVICSNNTLELKRKYLLEQLNIQEKQLQINEDWFEIYLIDLNELNNITNKLNELDIKNIKIKFNDQEIKL